MADCTSRNDSCSTCESRSSCLARGGCGYDVNDTYEPCKECTREQFHEVQQDCNGIDNCSDACKTCLEPNTEWQYSVGQTFDTSNTQTGMSECPWICDSGYYRGGTNMNECIKCADTTGLICRGAGLTYSNDSNPTGFSCSDGLQLVPDDATKTYSCQSCRDFNATLENGNCKCNQNYYGAYNGLNTQCTACPRNSTTDGATGSTSISACICNIGYYDAESGTNSVSCTKCPIGMTTVTLVGGNPTNRATKGATSINQCAMNYNTQFCIPIQDPAQRQQCFTLDGAAKINDREINTTISPTNSGN